MSRSTVCSHNTSKTGTEGPRILNNNIKPTVVSGRNESLHSKSFDISLNQYFMLLNTLKVHVRNRDVSGRPISTSNEHPKNMNHGNSLQTYYYSSFRRRI